MIRFESLALVFILWFGVNLLIMLVYGAVKTANMRFHDIPNTTTYWPVLE